MLRETERSGLNVPPQDLLVGSREEVSSDKRDMLEEGDIIARESCNELFILVDVSVKADVSFRYCNDGPTT